MACVLLPLDTSEVSASALPYARSLAQALGLPLVLLAVWDGTDQDLEGRLTAVQTAETERVAIEIYREYLERIAGELQASGFGAVSIAVRKGRPVDEILASAREHEAAYVVMATHGRGGLGRLLFGSVADRLVHSCPVPLLLVHPPAEGETAAFAPRRIVVPLDGSELGERALGPAAALAGAFGAQLVLLRAVPFVIGSMGIPGLDATVAVGLDAALAEAASEYLGALSDRYPGSVAAVRRGDAGSAIVEFAKSEGADLVVMSTHGRSGLARWTLGSVAGYVLGATRTPTLLVPAGRS